MFLHRCFLKLLLSKCRWGCDLMCVTAPSSSLILSRDFVFRDARRWRLLSDNSANRTARFVIIPSYFSRVKNEVEPFWRTFIARLASLRERTRLGTHGCSPRLNGALHQRRTSRLYDYRLVIEEERRPWNFRNTNRHVLVDALRTCFCFPYKATYNHPSL